MSSSSALNELLGNIENDDEVYVENDGSKSVVSNNDLISASWASLASEENSIEDKFLNNSPIDLKNTNTMIPIQENTNFNIDEILDANIKELKDIDLINYELHMITNARKHLKQLVENSQIDKLTNMFNWIIKASSNLSERYSLNVNQNKLPKIENNTTVIPRSSYKFCDYNYECEFHYGKKKKGCYAQHFVHNLVLYDVTGIVKYINVYKDTPEKINTTEINKSINTLLFVLNHMHDETQNINYYGFVSKNPIPSISSTPNLSTLIDNKKKNHVFKKKKTITNTPKKTSPKITS